MAVTSEQNIFLAPYLGSSLAKFISGGHKLCWEQPPGCLDTFYTKQCSCFDVYVIYSLMNAEAYSESSQMSEMELFWKNS